MTIIVVQSPSRVRLFATPWTAAHQASLSFTIPKFAQVHVHFISDAIHPSHPLIPSSPLPSISPSIRDFSSESAVCIRWSKYWSFSFSIGPSNEYSGFISFKTDWFDFLTVQGTLRGLLQHHSSKGISFLELCLLYCSAFTAVHDDWEDHSLDYMDLCQQSGVSAFWHIF